MEGNATFTTDTSMTTRKDTSVAIDRAIHACRGTISVFGGSITPNLNSHPPGAELGHALAMTAEQPHSLALPTAPDLEASLSGQGFMLLSDVVTPDQADTLTAAFDADALFRSTVVMERHNYGRGVYRYFANPLPAVITDLRRQFYRALAPVANRWAELLNQPADYPAEMDTFLHRPHGPLGDADPVPDPSIA